MDTHCTYHERREEILIAYLYDDIDAAGRAAFGGHLAGCATCRHELDQLGIVRRQLEAWTPPEPAWARSGAGAPDLTFRPGATVRAARWGRLADIPLWAQVAAAMLVIGVSAALANLDIKYDRAGLSVRTGWMTRAPASAFAPSDPGASARQALASGDPGASARQAAFGSVNPDASRQAGATASAFDPAVPVRQVVGQDQAAPWRAELAALEAQLRQEMRSSAAQPRVRAVGQTDADVEAMLVRVRALIEESEQRQQRELALRIAEVDTSVRAQRIADLRNIDRNLTVIQSNTGVDMRRLYQMTNDLAVRVSQAR